MLPIQLGSAGAVLAKSHIQTIKPPPKMEALRYQIIRHFSILPSPRWSCYMLRYSWNQRNPSHLGHFCCSPKNQHDLTEKESIHHDDSSGFGSLGKDLLGPGDSVSFHELRKTWDIWPQRLAESRKNLESVSEGRYVFFVSWRGSLYYPFGESNFTNLLQIFEGISLIIMHGLGW